MNNETMVIIDQKSGDVETIPLEKNQRYRAKLDTVPDVRRELAKLYRETRSGLIDPADATKLGWLLGEVRKSIELESRLIESKSIGEQVPMVITRIICDVME